MISMIIQMFISILFREQKLDSNCKVERFSSFYIFFFFFIENNFILKFQLSILNETKKYKKKTKNEVLNVIYKQK